MFRNFLTYQFAEGFDRDCATIDVLDTTVKNELLRCSHALVVHLGHALRTENPAERAKSLFTALAYSQDCREILDRAGIPDGSVGGKLRIVQGRLEQIFADSSKAEGGQYRMLG